MVMKCASGRKAAVWVRDCSGVPPYFGGTRAESPTRGTRGTPKKRSLQFAVKSRRSVRMRFTEGVTWSDALCGAIFRGGGCGV